MHKRQVKKKINIFFKAFTLAEMMVILTVLSVIMAATMPVITAKQKLTDGKISSFAGGSSSDTNFNRNDNYESLSYGGDFIAINMQPTDSKELETARVFVKSRSAQGIQQSSHIGLFNHTGDLGTLPAGRIAMGDSTNGNVAIGDMAMYANNTISTSSLRENVAIGYYAQSMFSTSAGSAQQYGNVSLGYMANSNTSGNLKNLADTVKIGTLVETTRSTNVLGYSNSSDRVSVTNTNINLGNNANGPGGIFIGRGAYDDQAGGKTSLAIGYYAKAGSASGAIAIGTNAYGTLVDSVTIGTYAMYGIMSGSTLIHGGKGINSHGQVAIGYGSMYHSSVYASVAIGEHVFTHTYGNTDSVTPTMPYYNIAIGAFTGWASSTKSYGNIFLGHYAGMGSSQIKNVICIGYKACAGTTKVKSGIFIGSQAGHHVDVDAPRSYIGGASSALGYTTYLDLGKAWSPKSNADYSQMIFAPADEGKSLIWLNAYNVYGPKTTMDTYSDRRLKENIRITSASVNDFRKLNIYEYNLISDKSKTNKIGVIAQELKKIYPNAVLNIPNSKYLGVKGDWILYSAVKAIKDLDESIEQLKKDLVQYVQEYKYLTVRVAQLEKQVKSLEKENKTLVKDVNVVYKKSKEKVNR